MRALVNYTHSRLNATRVACVEQVRSTGDVLEALRLARACGVPVCIAGGRQAMGGQQFARGGLLLDTTGFDRVRSFDAERGLITVEAGIQWPALMDWLAAEQPDDGPAWGIRQKQTGADRFSVGGSLSANVHGGGLTMGPIVGDVERFTLVDAAGCVRACSRTENPDLFGLAIGGYGLFGVITSVTLRLARRRKLRRQVSIVDVTRVMGAFKAAIAGGALYGDFQYATDATSSLFLNRGIFSRYVPVSDDVPVPADRRVLTTDDWRRLVHLAHHDKTMAFREYSRHYLATSGQVYWSDDHQRSAYLDDYHAAIDTESGAPHAGSEVIGELCVPRGRFVEFMRAARDDLQAHDVDVIYGTVRLVEKDEETVLAWAREPWVCVVFNVHTEHTPAGRESTASAFRRLIDIVRGLSGSYHLTYGRHAGLEQIEACHPRFAEFLRLKRAYDPSGLFQSDWYRHHRDAFAGRAAPAAMAS